MAFVSFRFPVLFVWFLSVTALVAGLSYAPKNVTCPTDLIRYGDNGLSPLESQYISERRTKATQSLQSWLERVNLENFDVSSFLANTSNVPTLAIAFSGGGYRAMLNGAGVFQGIRSIRQR
jgi:Lysophospholipase catalytic domain